MNTTKILGTFGFAGALAASCGAGFSDIEDLRRDPVRDFNSGPGLVYGIPFYEARNVCNSVCRTIGPNVRAGGTIAQKLNAETDSGEFITQCVEPTGTFIDGVGGEKVEDTRIVIKNGVYSICTVPMVHGEVQTAEARLEACPTK